MARKIRTTKPAMETRLSIDDPRVQRVPVKDARQLFVTEPHHFDFEQEGIQGAIVWVRCADDLQFESFRKAAEQASAAVVKRLPVAATDQPLALEPDRDAPLPESDVSEVRPVVTELLEELSDELRPRVTEYVESLLASHGL